MQIIKTKEFIEYIGHFNNETLCAKLTILADLYAIEHKIGYAKFKIEDEDKLELVNNKLDYAGDPAMPINVYIDNTLVNGFYTKTNYSITSTGVFGDSSNSEVSWTAPQPNFLGLSTSQNATEPDVGYAVGDTLYFPSTLSATTFYFYAIYEQQSSGEDTITDLTGTTWLLNEEPTLSQADYYINFTSNSTSFVGWSDIGNSLVYVQYNGSSYTPTAVLSVTNNGTMDNPDYVYSWVNNAYRTITITGGDDVTNSSLISWLQANATQQTAPTPTTQIALGRAFIKQVISADTYYLTWDNSSNTLNISVNGNTVSQGYELQDGDIIDIAIPQRMVGGLVILANNNSAPSSISDTDIYISTTTAGGGGGSIK